MYARAYTRKSCSFSLWICNLKWATRFDTLNTIKSVHLHVSNLLQFTYIYTQIIQHNSSHTHTYTYTCWHARGIYISMHIHKPVGCMHIHYDQLPIGSRRAGALTPVLLRFGIWGSRGKSRGWLHQGRAIQKLRTSVEQTFHGVWVYTDMDSNVLSVRWGRRDFTLSYCLLHA